MNEFLVIKSNSEDPAELTYVQTSLEAALTAGKQAWNWNPLGQALRALKPGDELDVDSETSIIRLTGNNPEFKE
jgi:hypothetical protein